MNKSILLLLCMVLMAALLSACGCEHEWAPADCEKASTCELCGKTEGAPLGHTWLAATCEAPKTCEVCKKTEGQANGHSWAEATCEAPKTCSACKKTEGKALGHTWMDATTEAPKTCQVCQATEGSPIETDKRFTTAACKPLFGSWEGEMELPGEQMGVPAEENLSVIAYYGYTFHTDGSFTMSVSYEEDSYFAVIRYLSIESIYETYAQLSMDRSQADAYHLAENGMTIAESVDASIAQMNIEDFELKVSMVYYVSGNQIYAGTGWDGTMEPATFSLEGDTLTIEDSGIDLKLTKVEE